MRKIPKETRRSKRGGTNSPLKKSYFKIGRSQKFHTKKDIGMTPKKGAKEGQEA